MVGCGKTDEPKAESEFTVSPSSIQVKGEGEQASFTVLCTDEDWMARADADWVKLLTVTAKASAQAVEVKFIAAENTTTAQRSASVIVSTLSGKKTTVSITQAEGQEHHVTKGISTADELVAFAKAFNAGSGISAYQVDGEVKLLCDIDASSIKEWTPVGTSDIPFGEVFNGGGYSIKNVSWSVDTDAAPYAGLIGYAKNATVKNLTFGSSEGSTVTFTGGGAIEVGGIVGHAELSTLTKLTNNAALSLSSGKSAETCFGGIAGSLDSKSVLGDAENIKIGCVNNGNLSAGFSCREGGLAGASYGLVANCTNNGTIKGVYASDGKSGPAWGCSYNADPDLFYYNYGYGFVQERPALHANAVVYPAANYDATWNTVDMKLDAYYDWEVVEEKQLHAGVKYSHCSFTGMNRHMHVLQIDLSNPEVELTTAYADECVPNPNGNKNSNNGKNIRETLSDVCARRCAAGQKIIAGVNSGFFDSNDGISRGYHIEECEPVYVNNPAVVSSLSNHVWGFTVFTDGTASCGKKSLSAKAEIAGAEYKVCSVNDTILRHKSAAYELNMYTSRYVQYPHPEKTTLVNSLAANVLYVVAEYKADPVKVNAGWAEAVVKNILDGTVTPLDSTPYLSSSKEVALSISGSTASAVKAALKTGDTIRLKFDMTIDGVSKPIYTQNSSMYKLMDEGKDASNTPGSSASLYTTYDPMTYPVVSRDGKTVWLIEIDGRQPAYSIGVLGYEMYRIAEKLGGWNVTRLDGGGSSCMWVGDGSSGKIVNSVSDKKGERSCLNYLLVRLK